MVKSSLDNGSSQDTEGLFDNREFAGLQSCWTTGESLVDNGEFAGIMRSSLDDEVSAE